MDRKNILHSILPMEQLVLSGNWVRNDNTEHLSVSPEPLSVT